MEAPAHPLTPLALAYMIAKDHRLFIVEVTEQGRPAWVVYRPSPVRGERAIRLGRRADPSGLLRFVRVLTGEARP